MDYIVLKGNILLWCNQPSLLPATNITRQIFLFDGLAWNHASAQIVSTAVTICLNDKYFLFCDRTWKHPVYIISQTRCSTNIFVWWSGLKTWFHADCCHSNYQMLKQTVFLVFVAQLENNFYKYILSVTSAQQISLFDGQAWKHYSKEIIGYNNIYLLYKYHALQWKYVLFHGSA